MGDWKTSPSVKPLVVLVLPDTGTVSCCRSNCVLREMLQILSASEDYPYLFINYLEQREQNN